MSERETKGAETWGLRSLFPRRVFRRLASRLQPVIQSDTAFVQTAYRQILNREADPSGLEHYRGLLRDGVSRTAVLMALMRSLEFKSKLTRPSPLQRSLLALRPDSYRVAIDLTNNEGITLFDVQGPDDFDWLERAILEHGYYEHAGVWNFGIDTDKRVIAEIVASFAPARPLELGCAAGAVLECLEHLGVKAEGIDISSLAIAKASPAVRDRIHHGDLLALDLPSSYDMVFGLDIFEHLNPNRLDEYLRCLARITTPEAYLFCNIPAFGDDAVFGTVFPLYVEGWEQDRVAGRIFSSVHVDDLGYPIHGHLVWADAAWWVSRFEACGFRRSPAIERELHRKYDGFMEKDTPARKAYFVFSRQSGPDRDALVIQRIRSTPSLALQPSL